MGVGASMNQTSFEYTSTRSTFTLNVDEEVELKATFLSPVTPDDLMRSSLPYSYLEVEVRSTDNKTHDVQLYTDISAGKAFALIIENTADTLARMGVRRSRIDCRVGVRYCGRECQPRQLRTSFRTLFGGLETKDFRNKDCFRYSGHDHSPTMEHACSNRGFDSGIEEGCSRGRRTIHWWCCIPQGVPTATTSVRRDQSTD